MQRILILFVLLLICAESRALAPFLPNWMGELAPAIGKRTILELSLPGTHDTMTYDLSTTVSDGANDIDPLLADILHEFHDADGIGAFVRTQAKTQGLNITAQLNSGIRFVDFRVMYTAPPNANSSAPHDWYCLHFMETEQPALSYLEEVRSWLLAHPTEVLVFWVSRHGSTCTNKFPDVPPSAEQKLFSQTFGCDIPVQKFHFVPRPEHLNTFAVEAMFEGLLFSTETSRLNETSLGTLVAKNQRMVMFFSNKTKFTSSSLAMDACQYIDNSVITDVTNQPLTAERIISDFGNGTAIKQQHARENRFWLVQMGGGEDAGLIEYAATIEFIPFGRKIVGDKCAHALNIPGNTYCPLALQDASQLQNYYNQIYFEIASRNISTSASRGKASSWGFPNAIYIDAVDVNGTIRTGINTFGSDVASHGATKYAYVDTLLLYNVLSACSAGVGTNCGNLIALLEKRREYYPLTLWTDEAYGRLEGWPVRVGSADRG